MSSYTGLSLDRRTVKAVAGTITALIIGVRAQAADEETVKGLAPVIVTGSRIAAPNLESTSPIQVVSEADIRITGKSDISDIINQLPQNFNNDLGQDLGNRTSGLSTAGGVATADLRGLGPNRTLVLVNGRRLGQGSPYTFIQSPAPDLDQIPTALVERVEVVTGGASAVYGSDAIAGVINFILKKDFEGLQIDVQLGQNWHNNHSTYVQGLVSNFGEAPLTGSSIDGRNQAYNLTVGTNFDDGRGNVTAWLGYLNAAPVTSGDRDFGGCQLGSNANLDGAFCRGSTNSNWFTPLTGPNAGTTYGVLGNSFIPWGSQATTPPAEFNSQKYIYMTRQDQRYTAGFMAHDDIQDYVKPYVEFSFMNDQTRQEVAPSALFTDSNPNDLLSGNYNVNCSNPLLSAQQQATICSPADIAADALAPGSVTSNVQIGRRNIEGGGRVSIYEHTNMRAVVGAAGDFAKAWTYDAYGQYYYTTFYNTNNRYLNFSSIDRSLLVTGTAANPVCISGAPCVPYNIFRDGAVTPAQLSYLYLDGTGYGTTTLRTLHADVTGQLGEYGITIPWAADGLAVNLGYEQRVENVSFAPDSGELSGQLSGFGSAAVAIDNDVSVDEWFVELRAPIVQDKPGVKELMFDAGFRTSDYSTAGIVNTHKFEVQYAPIDGLRFRGSYQKAIRAASIVELYNPQLVGLIQFGNDPCAPSLDTNNNQVAATRSLADCMRTGVTPAQYGNGLSTNTIPQGVLGQLSQLQGGNPELQPEQADSYTVGITITPSILPNFTGSIDYYDIKLEGLVGTVGADIIMSNCLDTGSPTYCSQIVRSPNTGGLVGNSIASGGYIVQTNVNIGAAEVSGIDVQAAYKLMMMEGWGSLVLSLNGAYLLETKTTPIPGAHTYDCAGLYGSTCQTVNPVWHHILRTTWQMPWDASLSLTWRYLSGVKLDNNDSDPTLNFAKFGKYNYFNAQIPSYGYLDIAGSWNITKGFEVRGGINNVLDKDPPLATYEITSGGAANTYSTYDALGRQMFIAFTAKF
jgi:outer membrane receptor protein involved in Fe transport